MQTKAPSLSARALRLLSAREHSRAELERKLQAYEDTPGSLAQVLDTLQAKGFINETRVVESLLHRRAAKLGAARIQQELQSKGLPAEAITEAVASLRDSELERAHSLWNKKFGTPPATLNERARQMRFLLSRGFSAHIAKQVIG